MKILILFLDMVRTDHLNLYVKTKRPTSLDIFLSGLGGSLYNNCYSPSPDTPRSMACMQTGLLPYKNGCDTRIKWPKFFIKEGLSTIFDHYSESGFDVNLCINQEEYETGFFKYRESEKIKYFPSPDDFITNGRFGDDSFSFIGFPDFHTAISDYCSTEYSLKKGWDIFAKFVEKYLKPSFVNQFDYIITFSDHGMGLASESYRKKSSLNLLNDGRTRILMHIHKQGDESTIIDNRLASIVDIYATLMGILGKSGNRDGFDLLSAPQRDILHIEDHADFSVSPEVMVKQWRVITNDCDIRTNLLETIDCEENKTELNTVFPYLSETSPKILELKRQYEIWEKYKKINTYKPNYFTGIQRISSSTHKVIALWIKIYYKILGIIVKR